MSDAPESPVMFPPGRARLADESVADRIGRVGQDNRNGGRRALQGANCGRRTGDEDIHFEANQLRRKLRKSLVSPTGKARFQDEIASLGVAEFTHALQKCIIIGRGTLS